jgi:agmatinase
MSAQLSPALQGDTFLRAARLDVETVERGQWVVFGAPSELTKLSRGGTSFGPAEIRRASLIFDFFAHRQSQRSLTNIETGETHLYDSSRIVDVGDLVMGVDVHLNTRRIADAVAEIVKRDARPLMLGGDHYVTYPAVMGLAREIGSAGPLAYVHVDMHADMLDEVPEFGRLSCASPLRRLLEDGVIAPERTVIYGLDPMLSTEECELIERLGVRFVTNSTIVRDGVEATLAPALERILDGAGSLYASIDIDVLARTYAPGTGNAVGVSGITPDDLIDAARMLSGLPLIGADLVEVAPVWDPTGRTAGIAASVLIQLLWPALFSCP